MNWLDWAAIAVLGLSALSGLRRGLVAGVLSIAGLLAGVLVATRLAPSLVGEGGSGVPFVTLGGTVLGGFVGQWVGGLVGGWARRSLWLVPPLRWLDSLGGVVFGVATGLVLCWVVGTTILYVPGQDDLRRTAQESVVVSAITDAVSPSSVISALGRIDPFLTLVGPSANVDPPDPALLRDPDVRAARTSTVRIRGIACGVGIEGSGWIVRRGLVVTNAHVVAGIDRPQVDKGDDRSLEATVVSFDASNDIAVLRVPGLQGAPLRLRAAPSGTAAVILGYPGNGPFKATAGRVGRTVKATSRDAYGRLRLAREIVAFRGEVSGGSSGGPVIDAAGRVLATVFAKRAGSTDGFGVPNSAVTRALASAGAPLETACVER